MELRKLITLLLLFISAEVFANESFDIELEIQDFEKRCVNIPAGFEKPVGHNENCQAEAMALEELVKKYEQDNYAAELGFESDCVNNAEDGSNLGDLGSSVSDVVGRVSCTKKEIENKKTSCSEAWDCNKYRSIKHVFSNAYSVIQKPVNRFVDSMAREKGYNPKSCLSDEKRNCLGEFIDSLIGSLWNTMDSLWSFVKEGATSLWGLTSFFDDKAESLHAAATKSKSSIDKFIDNPGKWISDSIDLLKGSVNTWIKNSLFCQKWEGEPHMSRCEVALSSFDCLDCDTSINATCVAIGAIASEATLMILTAGTANVAAIGARVGVKAMRALSNKTARKISASVKDMGPDSALLKVGASTKATKVLAMSYEKFLASKSKVAGYVTLMKQNSVVLKGVKVAEKAVDVASDPLRISAASARLANSATAKVVALVPGKTGRTARAMSRFDDRKKRKGSSHVDKKAVAVKSARRIGDKPHHGDGKAGHETSKSGREQEHLAKSESGKLEQQRDGHSRVADSDGRDSKYHHEDKRRQAEVENQRHERDKLEREKHRRDKEEQERVAREKKRKEEEKERNQKAAQMVALADKALKAQEELEEQERAEKEKELKEREKYRAELEKKERELAQKREKLSDKEEVVKALSESSTEDIKTVSSERELAQVLGGRDISKLDEREISSKLNDLESTFSETNRQAVVGQMKRMRSSLSDFEANEIFDNKKKQISSARRYLDNRGKSLNNDSGLSSKGKPLSREEELIAQVKREQEIEKEATKDLKRELQRRTEKAQERKQSSDVAQSSVKNNVRNNTQRTSEVQSKTTPIVRRGLSSSKSDSYLEREHDPRLEGLLAELNKEFVDKNEQKPEVEVKEENRKISINDIMELMLLGKVEVNDNVAVELQVADLNSEDNTLLESAKKILDKNESAKQVTKYKKDDEVLEIYEFTGGEKVAIVKRGKLRKVISLSQSRVFINKLLGKNESRESTIQGKNQL